MAIKPRRKYWKVKYEGQAASWIVVNRSRGRMLRDYFPSRTDAQNAADALNEGRSLP